MSFTDLFFVSAKPARPEQRIIINSFLLKDMEERSSQYSDSNLCLLIQRACSKLLRDVETEEISIHPAGVPEDWQKSEKIDLIGPGAELVFQGVDFNTLIDNPELPSVRLERLAQTYDVPFFDLLTNALVKFLNTDPTKPHNKYLNTDHSYIIPKQGGKVVSESIPDEPVQSAPALSAPVAANNPPSPAGQPPKIKTFHLGEMKDEAAKSRFAQAAEREGQWQSGLIGRDQRSEWKKGK